MPDAVAQRLDFFQIDQLAVQVLLAQQPLPVRPDGAVPRVLLAGDSPLSRALLIELARHWRLRRDEPDRRVEVDFVAPDATRVLERVARRNAILRDACRIVPCETTVAELLADDDGQPLRYDRAFVFFTDEKYGLQLALTEYRLWHRVTGDVVVAVDGLAELADAFSPKHPPPLLDPLNGRLKLFSPAAAGCDPTLIAEDLSERLARLIHERYVAARLSRGARLGSQPALAVWSDLDESLRRANRLQAADIGPKLHWANCAIVPRDGGADDFRFTGHEVEELAKRDPGGGSRRPWRTPGRAAVRPGAGCPISLIGTICHPEVKNAVDAQFRTFRILGEAGFQMVRLSRTLEQTGPCSGMIGYREAERGKGDR